MRRLLAAATVVAVVFCICADGNAQNYPTRTVTLVVPYPPGGGVDTLARVVAEQLINDLLGSHVPVAFGVLPPALGNLQSGNLRAIAVLGPRRFSLLPEVPTANESGMPGFESVLHYGLLAPAGTPRPIVERLNKELRALVNTDQVRQRIQAEGGDPLISTPDEYAKDIDTEEHKWATLIRKLNLKVE